MTQERFTSALVCALAFVATIIYPPWVTTYAVEPASWLWDKDWEHVTDKGKEITAAKQARELPATSQLVSTTDGYSWLWEPPAGNWSRMNYPRPVVGVRPDMARLSMEWLAIAAVFAFLFWVAPPRTAAQPPASQPGKPNE